MLKVVMRWLQDKTTQLKVATFLIYDHQEKQKFSHAAYPKNMDIKNLEEEKK